MNVVQRIVKNTGIFFIAQIVSFIFSFFYLVYSTRFLGVANFGILSFALAFSGIVNIFVDLGLSPLMVRDVSRDKKQLNKYLSNIISIKSIFALLSTLIGVLIVYIFGYNQIVIEVIILTTIYFVFNSFAAMFYSAFQIYEKMEYASIGYMINSSILLIGTFVAIFFDLKNVLAFGFIFFFAGFLTFLYSLLACKWKLINPKISFDIDFWGILIKNALPLSLALIFATVEFNIDAVILSIFKGDIPVGIYTAAYRLIGVLLFIPQVFTAAIYPLFSNYHVSSKEYLKLSYKKSLKYITIVSIPIAVGVTLTANKIILLIYGAEFIASVNALQILIWAIPALFVTNTLGMLIVAINRQNLWAKILLFSMSLNIILNIIFIPTYSYFAAAYITVITEMNSAILIFYFLSKYVVRIKIQNIILKPAIASIIMGLFIYYIDLNFLLIVPLATIVYFVSLILLKGFSKEDISLFKKILDSRN